MHQRHLTRTTRSLRAISTLLLLVGAPVAMAGYTARPTDRSGLAEHMRADLVAPPATLSLAELAAGDLIITEVMANPSAVDDAAGEWFEIYNASGEDVDITGLELTDDGTDTYTVTTGVVIAADSYAVLAVNGVSASNGGIPVVDLTYTRSRNRFDNGTDELYLGYGGVVFDSLTWGGSTGFAFGAGASLSLDPAYLDAGYNDRAYYWCDGSTPYGAGDLGTPGEANDDCGLSGLTVDDLVRGELIITEVMVNPSKASDSSAEWFEIYVNTAEDVNLYGLTLSDNGTDTYTVLTEFIASAGSYVVIAANADSVKNGGLPVVDATYVRGSFRFDDPADEVYVSNSTTRLDEMGWKSTTGVTEGRSWALNPAILDPDANDTTTNWCSATAPYGAGDLGSPGTVNGDCEFDADGDGVTNLTDCDDADPSIFPGAPEICDSIDQDCDGVLDNDATDAPTWSLDYDRDSYGGGLIQVVACENPSDIWYVDNVDDCDDLDSNSFPSADEVCDGSDNDCDGETDEDPVDAVAFYVDADLDGYGDPATTSDGCEVSAGLVTNDLDCDDTASAAHPGGDEVCDSLDNDCNGDVDDSPSDGLTWYLDYDDDGYGATKITAVACEAPTYFVDTSTDCDDLDAEISPGAEEVCSDFVDNNCDDSALDCSVTGDVDLADADAKFTGDASMTDASRGLAGLGDINGDGFDDIGVGAPSTALDTAATSTGAAYVLYGPVTGTVALSTGANGTFTGETAGDQAGYSMHGAGDVNNDGYADVLIGARDEATGGEGAGAAYVVYGPVSGSESLSLAEARFTGEAASNVAGFAISGESDLDGDSVSDLVVGAYGNSTAATEAGAVYMLYGPISGDASLTDAGGILYGELASDRAGRWVSSEGDVDADGQGDLIVGAYLSDGDGSAADAGRAYLMLGTTTGTGSLADADSIFTGELTGQQAGYTVDNDGDVDGDGYDDLLISAVYENSVANRNGAVYVVYGPTSGSINLSAADAKLVGVARQDHAGVRTSMVFDANADGRDEVLVGSYGVDAGGTDAGAAFIAYGPVAGTVSLSAAEGRFIGEAAGDKAGTSVSGAGDTNGDGYGDLLVGSISEATGGANAGAAYLILGSGW